ncbi:MAG: iron ABC transporter permease [candidate division WOR-3 bacterium]
MLIAAAAVSFLIGPGGLPSSGLIKFRLLRLALGILAGGVLSLVGASLQGLLRNPLVDPFTLGVSSGSALGASMVIAWGTATSVVLPVAGFAGALVTILAVYLLARVRGRVTVTGLVLAGVIMSFLFSSLVMLVLVLARQPLGRAVYLLMGHLGVAFTRGSLPLFIGSAATMLAGCGLLVAYARDLDIMSSSEEAARSLGVDTARVTKVVFVVCSVLVGLVVSFTGAISFVGLVVPHLVRMILGPVHRRVLPASFLFGAALLLLADTAARNIVPGGLPLSVVTALIGVPFFIYLLRRRL